MASTGRWESEALAALSEQLAAADAHFELAVIGGSALVALGLVERATRDVDVLGILSERGRSSADPLPEVLETAGARVARDLGLPTDWLDPGPTALLDLGLPQGFLERTHRVEFGRGLVVLNADRYDQISHDPSIGFRQQLLLALGTLGVDDARPRVARRFAGCCPMRRGPSGRGSG